MRKFVCAALAALSVLFMGTVAEAQCRTRTYYSYPSTYQYPVKEVVREVITPVAIPVLVPAFQFQYVAPCATSSVAAASVPLQTLPSPVAAPTPTVPMQQMSFSPHSDQVRLLAKALLAEMNKQVDGQDNGPPVAVFDGGKQPPVAPNGFAVLGNRCASCHTGADAKAGVQIFMSPGIFNNAVDRQRVLRAIEEGRMPLHPETRQSYRLPADELAAVRQLLQ